MTDTGAVQPPIITLLLLIAMRGVVRENSHMMGSLSTSGTFATYPISFKCRKRRQVVTVKMIVIVCKLVTSR